MEEILIDISPTGEVTIEGKGIKGPDCVALTAEIEEALGDVESRKKTAEFNAPKAKLRKASA